MRENMDGAGPAVLRTQFLRSSLRECRDGLNQRSEVSDWSAK
jgi:hypothetical protein